MDKNNIQSIGMGNLAPRVRIANAHTANIGYVWGDRQLPDFQLLCPLRGRFEYCDANRRLELQPGWVLLIHPGRVHRLAYLGEKAGRLSGFHFEFSNCGSWLVNDYALNFNTEIVMQISDQNYMDCRFLRLAEVFAGYGRNRNELCSTIAAEIILTVGEHWMDPSGERSVSPRMRQMLAYIREHLSEPLSRQTLAREFGLSPEYINLLFRLELNSTPTLVTNRERALASLRWMQEEGISVKEAAYRAGFNDPLYFSRVFKRIMGMPPSQIR